MLRAFMAGGPVMFPLVLLATVVVVLAVVNAVRVFVRGESGHRVRSSINAILFWGAVAAVLGFLGQWNGHYTSVQTILREGPRVGINPAAVILGFGEALISAAVGLAILIPACLLWYLLHSRWSSLSRSPEPGR